LLEALSAKQAEVDFAKGWILQLQATMVLQRLYCGRVRRQLAAKEIKEGVRAKKKGGKLLGDGLPHLLTDDEFFEKVKAHWEAAEAAEVEREARKQQRQDQATEVENWKKQEEERKKRNQGLEVKWKGAVEEWERRKAEAKASGRKIKDWSLENPRPKKNDPEFKQEGAIPKPVLKKRVAAVADELNEEEFDVEDTTDNEE